MYQKGRKERNYLLYLRADKKYHKEGTVNIDKN